MGDVVKNLSHSFFFVTFMVLYNGITKTKGIKLSKGLYMFREA